MTDSSKSFSDYNLNPQLLKAIEDTGYTKCTPIQERCIPLILKNQDIAGLAQTGTGKTAAYLIPLIDRVLRSQNPEPEDDRIFPDWKTSNYILILVPTRELVTQVLENLHTLTKGTDLKSIFLFGGVGYEEQKADLSKPYQFLVSTPGRLIDLYKDKHLDFKQVRAVVFDEADRMFDMGFQQDVTYVLSRIPKERQLLMFSATLNLHVTEMAYEAHSNPVEIDVSRDQATADNVEDFIFHVSSHEKPKFLLSVLKKFNPAQVIIFSNYKNKVPRIAQFLCDNGYSALGISSLMNQNQRNRVIERFKGENSHNIMVATDLAARGLDIKGVDMVINFEMPEDAENYVHRIGRTGRAESKGFAYSFVSDRDVESMVRVEEYLKEKLEVIWLEESELVTDFKPLPPDESRRPSFPQRKEGRDGRPPRRNSGGGDRPRRTGGAEGGAPTSRPVPSTGPRTHGPGFNSGAPAGSPSVHRDKRSGRHRDKTTGDRPAQEARGNGSGPKKNFKKPHSNNRPRPSKGGYTGSRPVPKKQGAKGLLGRITSSVKSLFGK